MSGRRRGRWIEKETEWTQCGGCLTIVCVSYYSMCLTIVCVSYYSMYVCVLL